MTHKRHSALLERAKGFRTGRRTLFKRANEALLKAGQFAYRDRRNKKRVFRRSWISTINMAVRPYGVSYSQFMAKLKVSSHNIDRKIMAQMVKNDSSAFEALVKDVLKQAPSQPNQPADNQ